MLITGDGNTGKTTLLYLLAGLYKVDSGDLVINDLPIGNYNPMKLRSIIGDCLMDELLFEGSLLENITMGRASASMENVMWAIEKLGLMDFVWSLPRGLDTPLDPQGKRFSKGIVDKIILARSIADKPKLLLIKDTFSSLLGDEKDHIIKFITDKENPWTVVIVSRDMNLKDNVDRVFRLDDKKLKEV